MLDCGRNKEAARRQQASRSLFRDRTIDEIAVLIKLRLVMPCEPFEQIDRLPARSLSLTPRQFMAKVHRDPEQPLRLILILLLSVVLFGDAPFFGKYSEGRQGL